MKYNSIFLMALAIGLCVTLVFAENLQSAYAFSITFFDSGTTEPRSIARIGNQIAVGNNSVGSDDLEFFSATDPSVSTGTISACCTDGIYQLYPNEAGTRLYGFGGTTLYEFDPDIPATLRTFVHGCALTEGVFFDIEDGFVYCGTTTETVKKISLTSFSTTYTSTTLNAGATPCVTIADINYDLAADTLFASCIATDRLVAVEDFTVSGTPDFAVALTDVSEITFNTKENNLFACATATTNVLYNYTFTVGFSAWKVINTGTTCGASSENRQLVYDFTSDRFIFQDGAETIYVLDGTTGSTLFSAITTGGGATGGQVYVYNNNLSYIAFDGTGVITNDFAVFDMVGIALGGGGTSQGVPNTGVDCTLPENANILICRLGGTGVLTGTGNFIVGNVNGTTGLTPIICATGIVDCVANPDMKTNGVGYLLVTIALAIIIGILWVASRGDLNSIPTFIWFIATLAVVGAFTLMDLIDATFLVITAIIVVALAAAKVRGLFGGEFR